MTFDCNEDDEFDRPPPPRAIPRNCGQLLGSLDELLPFLYIAQYGASQKDLRAQRTDAAPGLFAVAACTGGDRPGLVPRVGLVLPVGLCRDEKLRAALLDIASLITDAGQARVSYQCRAVLDRRVIPDRSCEGLLAVKAHGASPLPNPSPYPRSRPGYPAAKPAQNFCLCR